MKTTLAKNPTAGWYRRLLRLTTALILLSAAPFARAQQDLQVTIPIEKVRLHYKISSEDGGYMNCGVELHGGFPVFKNYTNHNDYNLITPGLQRPAREGFGPLAPPPGGRFLFYCYFNGVSSPDPNTPCPSTIGEDHPDWRAELRRKPPRSAFTAVVSTSTPGEVIYNSQSTNPEDEPLTHTWAFGDGTTGSSSIKEIHSFTKPGTFRTTLTVANPDGITNATSRNITIPAPKLEASLRLPNNRPGNTKVQLGKEFTVRLRVGATPDGLGALSNVKFTTQSILTFPNWLAVVTGPSSVELGTLLPGESKVFDWVFKATNVGKFTIVSSSLSATDAADRLVTRGPASLNGSVPGLNVEVVFPEEPVRLVRKEPAEGAPLSEKPGYIPQGFPVILRVSVPEGGNPVRDVRLKNGEANDGGLDIDRVKRSSNPDVPWVQAVPQPVPFPVVVTNKASPIEFPGLLTSKSKPLDFKLTVETDRPGSFSFTGIVSAHQEDGQGEVTEVGTDVMTVGGDVVLAVQLELVHPLELPRITEGESVEVWGKVENMTWDETIRMHPVRVISLGQGLVLGPVPSDQTPPPVGIPGIFDPVLRPGDEATFRARVKTEAIPGLDMRLLGRTNVLLDFELGGIVVDEAGEERDLEREDMLVEFGKGGHRPSAGITLLRAQVDADPHDARLLSAEDFFYISAGKAMENLVLGGKDVVMVTIPQVLGSLIPGTIAVVEFGQDVREERLIAGRNASRYLWAWMDWQTDVYLGLESATREREFQQIAEEIHGYYSDRFDSVDQVRGLVNQGIEGYFTKVIDYRKRAYVASGYGFNEELATVVGEPFRAVGQLAVEELVSAAAVAGFVAKVTRSPQLLDEVAAAKAQFVRRSEQQVADATAEVARRGEAGDPRLVEATPGMRALPAGTKVTTRQAIDGWAVDKVSDQNLRKMTDVKNGGMPIIVALRSRADETIQWMKTQRGIVPKPVSFKPKNVDPDDVAFLGYRDGVGYGDANGVGAGDRGATILAEPFTREEVLARLDIFNADAATRKRVLERHDQRWEEWHGAKWPDKNPAESAVEKLKKFANVEEVVNGQVVRKGRLPVPRRGTVPDPSINLDVTGPGVMDERRFEMRLVKDPPGSAEFPEGREYWETWLEDDNAIDGRVGTMRRIAGDIDLVAVTDATGHALKTASEFTDTVGKNLQHAIQAQHPWSSSLMKDSMRKKFLDPHRWNDDPALRGEPLLLYVNGEARVGWFHPTRAITAENPLDGFMWLDGGTGDVDDVVRFQRDMRGTLDNPADVAVASFTPAKVNVRAAMIDSDNARSTTLLATCAIRTARTGGAVYRLGQSETLEKRAQDGTWQPADPALQCDNGEILIVPDTALSDDVVAGALRLPIVEEMLGFDWQEMFRIGDQVLIDPGSPQEEIRTVVNHGSLIVDRPLTHFHPMGTPVVLYKTREQAGENPSVPPPRGGPLVWLRADAGVELDGTRVVSWTDQSPNQFIFSTPALAARPTWVANSTSGIPAVRFAGFDFPELRGDLRRTLTNATIFTLGRFLDNGGGQRFIYSFGTRNFSGLMMTLARLNSDGANHFDGAAQRNADNTIPGTDLLVFSQVFGEEGPDRHRLTVNLKTVLDTRTTTGRAYSAIATNVVLGRSPTLGGFGGDLVEWIVYDRALSAAERFEVEEYLRQRAGLAPFVPPGSADLAGSEMYRFGTPADPHATWTLDEANRVARPGAVGVPSLLLSGGSVSNQVIRTRLSPGTGDGAVGVVFGYQDPGWFQIFDWRAADAIAPELGYVPAGMRLRSFVLPKGQEPTAADLGAGLDSSRVAVLRTNDVPWVAGREYELVLTLLPGETVLEVNWGTTNLVTWKVPELAGAAGRFGHYAESAPNSRLGPMELPGLAPFITGIEPDDDGNWLLHWANGQAPYLIEARSTVDGSLWESVAPATANQSQSISVPGDAALFRIRSTGVTP